MMRGLEEAVRQGIPVEQADAAMGAAAGLPRTGIFGLFDMVGIDLMLHTASTMTASPALPADDPMHKLDREKTVAVLDRMVEEGYTGRKGKGGFYRLNTEEGQKIKEVRDLASGEYHAEAGRKELTGLDPRKGRHQGTGDASRSGAYAWAVLSDTLCYAASLVPAIADGITAVDEAMRKGFHWKHGPFEMIDSLGVEWFIGKLRAGRTGGSAPPRNRTGQELFYHRRRPAPGAGHRRRIHAGGDPPRAISRSRTSSAARPHRWPVTTTHPSGTWATESPASS